MTLREDYNRDGYVVVRKRQPLWFKPAWEPECLKRMFDDDVNKYIGYLGVWAKDIEIQKYILQVDLFPIFGNSHPIIISQPILHVMSPALRIPDGYYGTAAHQDWPSTQGSLDCVTVWIALSDASVGNFPLEVIPGSHKRGLLDGKMNGSVLEVEVDEKEFVPIECKAGDVVFLSGFTVHRTGNGTGFRVSVSQRFDNASEPTFIERGYPCAQKRVVERELKWKPTVEEVRRIYDLD